MLSETRIETESTSDNAIRAVDISMALLLILAAAPVLILKYLYRRCRYGAAIERIHIYGARGKPIGLYQFTGEGICCQWPYLINLLKGDLSLVGSEITFNFTSHTAITPEKETQQIQITTSQIKPGILTFKQMHQRVGLNFESQNPEVYKAQKNPINYLLAALRILLTGIFSSYKTNNAVAQIPLLGLKLDNLTMDELLENITQHALNHQRGKLNPLSVDKPIGVLQYAFVNADCLNISAKDPSYLRCLRTSCHKVFADGSGIRLASQWKGYSPKDNLNGTDMFPRLCEQLSKKGLSLFLLGGEAGVAAKTAVNMQRKLPNLQIAGTHHGFLNTPKLNQAVIDQINDSGASILLVAMGAPKQEIWLESHQAKLDIAIGIGVGGLFDFYSGNIKRAPLWVRQLGMEWICRLAEEPVRMWKRYILGNPLFLCRVCLDIFSAKQSKSDPIKGQVSKPDLVCEAQRYSQTKSDTRFESVETPISNKLLNLTDNQVQNRQALNRCRRKRVLARMSSSLKRGVDLIGASTLLILLLPLLVIISVLIRLESKGPIIFSQQRAGKDNALFTMWKFRSMYQNAECRLNRLQSANEMPGGILFKMKKDPRITLVGRLIRKMSIDELPQLWNVICGDMSLVGPRPALESEVKQYSLHDRKRLSVKPGITCIWQVSGRSDIPFEQQVELDIDYIYKQSFLTDIWLLIKTIPAVIWARGAY
ncbi:exopolysaccharide biosynthesis protein, WecB/TagA/CpsF family [Shewanella psychrophila]|uniref:Exopolysaccharide biosynthesis protein, WecB/TagA/CpsF family n=1 Tax=Shewanella psychrophila TaxID=225848 RepID=A0A1S6HTK4_9GAMM|nr:WecB/TagA/CpsF family glycosyltransferase [Shewanella psychrophila]AQS38811.1 exopolysaccharide biosynthesis protein, WecB/TagA/CpsF family [Shewanella psychrophila]